MRKLMVVIRKKPHTAAVALVGLWLLSSPATAQGRQNFEISPFAGYWLGAETGTLVSIAGPDTVKASDHSTFGLRFGYRAGGIFEPEVQASRVQNSLESSSAGRSDLTIDYLMGYATFNFLRQRIQPYAGVGAGIAVTDRFGDRLTTSACIGVKVFISPHVAFRLDARGYVTSLPDARCLQPPVCFDCGCENRERMTNREATAGVLFRL